MNAPHEAALCLVDGKDVPDDAFGPFLSWLSDSEQARLGRFVRRERRRQFLIGRVLLRRMLGRVLGMEASLVPLLERHGQAPQLAMADCEAVGFSLSHSGPWVACAVSAGTALGLDIEMRDGARDLAALAAQAFDAHENAWLAARPQADRVHDFYRLWSAKEAQYKLHAPSAQCISLEHAELSVSLCSAQPLARVPSLALVPF
ncbi:4'-phosphopantetheinyl transferase family protein [Massilia glaciei]|uniref:4-phosphopantetheinyl transferase n=1 Tax=Massilia glaciei TaxID=1524097 RepID=A0A2U2HE32_9BURK|nr:4'-phosphopantetheinyl transferase superfamily protein [Massilia glaciei]PWF41558.1 4-phosphopantetheinyl transferase [Massilia glaciei]